MKQKLCNHRVFVKQTSISTWQRLHYLEALEDMFSDFYLPYNKAVAKPYSDEDQNLLSGITKSMIQQLKGTSHYAAYGPGFRKWHQKNGTRPQKKNRKEQLEQCRLVLSPIDPFSASSRLYTLKHLEEMISNFLYLCAPSVNEHSYSYHEQRIIARIIKLLMHQLRGSQYYLLFVKKRRPRKLTPEEQQESINQRKDEARLRFITLASYNPLSNKYKALKKQL